MIIMIFSHLFPLFPVKPADRPSAGFAFSWKILNNPPFHGNATHEVTGFVIILHSQHYPLSDTHCHHPAHGQTADRADGGIGICRYHAGGKSGFHPHAGWRDPLVFRGHPHCDSAGCGIGTVCPGYEKHKIAEAAVWKAGNFGGKRKYFAKKFAKNPNHLR